MALAGGTDLIPNMKQGLLEPSVVVSLGAIDALCGIVDGVGGSLEIGAMASLDEFADDERVRKQASALAQAAGLVASPHHRRMGTIGGNIMLDTRCRLYNQSCFWRSALWFCLKRDGTICHVVAGGKKCVAAASNDTVPPLMTLGASLGFDGTLGKHELPIDEFWTADGTWNKRVLKRDLPVSMTIPPTRAGHRSAYEKLRIRGSIDFPLLGVAARVDLGDRGEIVGADLVLGALQAKPIRMDAAADNSRGERLTAGIELERAVEKVAASAMRRCKPLADIPGDADYRRAMVPVYVRRALMAPR
ncbi:MAG: hypothetical protein CME06_09325 [Gemmatimonadetes bacterium]|nr:hypothetical protein [Gemmatimonadota bacterium]